MLTAWASSLPAVLVFLSSCLFLASGTGASPSALLPRQRPPTPPSAASFYVSNIPSLTLDPSSPLHVWSGHISADPKAKVSPATDVTAQLYFVLTKARRTADKERLIIWFNVCNRPHNVSVMITIDGNIIHPRSFREDQAARLSMAS